MDFNSAFLSYFWRGCIILIFMHIATQDSWSTILSMPHQHTTKIGRRNRCSPLSFKSIGRLAFDCSRTELLVHVEKCKLSIRKCWKEAGKLWLATKKLLHPVTNSVSLKYIARARGSPGERESILLPQKIHSAKRRGNCTCGHLQPNFSQRKVQEDGKGKSQQ